MLGSVVHVSVFCSPALRIALDQGEEGVLRRRGPGLREQSIRSVVCEDLARAHEQQAIAAGCLIHHVTRDEKGGAALLQAAEQSLGLALSREILAADALCDGRLVQLSSVAITHRDAEPYHIVYPPGLRDWPPVVSLRQWLHDELDLSYKQLNAQRKGRRIA